MKSYIILFGIFFCSVMTYAQTAEEIRQEILEYQKCYNSWSIPLSNTHSNINGTNVKYIQETNYKKATFLIADEKVEKALPASIKDINIRYSKQEKSFHILAHGLTDSYLASTKEVAIGDYSFKAEEMAELILEKMRKYEILLKTMNEPFTVVIHSCKAGMGANSFAQQLSAVLAEKVSDVAVVASPDLIWPHMKNGQYKELIAPTRAHADRTDFEGENWIVFKDGKAYMDGTPDYNETVQKYLTHEQKQILKRVADKYRKVNGL